MQEESCIDNLLDSEYDEYGQFLGFKFTKSA